MCLKSLMRLNKVKNTNLIKIGETYLKLRSHLSTEIYGCFLYGYGSWFKGLQTLENWPVDGNLIQGCLDECDDQ